MESDTIWIATSKYVDDNWSGDVAGKVLEFVQDIYGSDYSYWTYRGLDIGTNASTMTGLFDWWVENSFTDNDRNLLIVDKSQYSGSYGVAESPESNLFDGKLTAAIIRVNDSIMDIGGPNSGDNELIGTSAVDSYTGEMQMAGAIHELTHLYYCTHDEGYGDHHDYLNFTSPILTGYADDIDTNACSRGIGHQYYWNTRYVQGIMKCAVTNSQFNHKPDQVYTAPEVNSL